MNSYTRLVAVLFVLAGTGAGAAAGQENPAPEYQKSTEQRNKEFEARQVASLNDKTPLQVQVVVSRYLGEKRISAMPYVLTVNAVGPANGLMSAESSQLQMGSTIPIRGTTSPDRPRESSQVTVGTVIDCRARSMGDGRFELRVSVDDNSLSSEPRDGAAAKELNDAVVRNFQARQVLILREGQSRQFTAATDRVTGEVVRIDVTLTVVK